MPTMDPKIYIATGSDDGLAKVWVFNPEKPDRGVSCQASLVGHTAGITSVSWNPHPADDDHFLMKHNPEEEQLLTSSKDQTLKIWRPYHKNGPQQRTLPVERKGDLDDGLGKKEKEVTKHSDYINMASWRPAIGVSHDLGKQVVSCSDDGTAAIWDVSRIWDPLAEKIATQKDPAGTFTSNPRYWLRADGIGHTRAVTMATWSPEGNRILTCSHDAMCIVWSPKNGHHIKLLPATPTKEVGRAHTGPIWSARFSPDGHEVVTASADRSVRVWDCNTGQCIVNLRDPKADPGQTMDGAPVSHKEVVFDANWNPYESYQILSCSLDGTAKIWDKRDKRVSLTLDHHQACVWSAVFGNDPNGGGRMILTSSHDMTALVYDQRLAMPKNSLLGHTGILWQASFDPTDQYVVTCSEDRTARLWNLSTGARRPPSSRLIDPVHPHKQAVQCAAFRPPIPLH